MPNIISQGKRSTVSSSSQPIFEQSKKSKQTALGSISWYFRKDGEANMMKQQGGAKAKETLERAISVTSYIYNRTQVLNMMREFTGQKDMVRLAKTRFATAFLTLRSFHKHKANSRRMFTSD
ncbi:hypothetical protein Cni_G01499 [Canna indica]|uniref:Uncharacterized protein n=1 Tax=Canna indica TaxID=4628 RepID=A0AAQ3JPD4_9LILI|nr:hypothetical protein Cni_G01499 [Canna indica]